MRLKAMRTAIEKVVVVNKVIGLAAAHRARKGLVTVDEYLIERGVDEGGRSRPSSGVSRGGSRVRPGSCGVAGCVGCSPTSVPCTWGPPGPCTRRRSRKGEG
jgi:hypothetical protein